MLRSVSFTVTIDDAVRATGPWSATRMPYRGTLQVHLFPVPERITALGASRASRMKVMIITGLEDFAADVAVAVGALYAKLFLIILLAVRYPVSGS